MRRFLGVLPLLLSAHVAGQSFTEGFAGGTNQGNWWYGPPGVTIEPIGGNPGEWLHDPNVSSVAPIARTTTASVVFHGDYRDRGVLGISTDFITIAKQFGDERPATLMLVDYNGTPSFAADDNVVYFLGTDVLPQPNQGWKTIGYAIPSSSPTLPIGWFKLQGAGNGDQVWNTVIQNVDQIRWFYGNPQGSLLFQQWDVGMDNVTMTANDLGGLNYCAGKPNSQGCVPVSTGSGLASVTFPAPFVVGASNTLNNKPGMLFFGLAPTALPFQGGTLCVMPPLQRMDSQPSGGNPPPDDCSGSYATDFNAIIQGGGAPGLVAGADVFCQHWMRDPAVDATGVALSDGLRFQIAN